jgi:hypothetical protein
MIGITKYLKGHSMKDFDGLLSCDHIFETGAGKRLKRHTLNCWLEFEAADSSVGLQEDWTVFYAFLNGVDISEILSDAVHEEIILGAMQYCADEAKQAAYF